jgi:hypothetical protein
MEEESHIEEDDGDDANKPPASFMNVEVESLKKSWRRTANAWNASNGPVETK